MLIKKLNQSGSLLKPPISKKIKSGLVILKPGQEIGRHTTGSSEEVIIILKGKARLILGKKRKTVGEGHLVFVPRQTFHNVNNSFRKALKYIYIVAR